MGRCPAELNAGIWMPRHSGSLQCCHRGFGERLACLEPPWADTENLTWSWDRVPFKTEAEHAYT